MKILHVDETFHPSYGYHTNPLARFQRRQGHAVTIVTVEKRWIYPVYKEFGIDDATLEKEDHRYEEETGVKIIRVPARGYFMRRLVFCKELFDIVEQQEPDVVYVHCVETITAMRFLLRKKKYPMMFDSHMLAMASGNRFAKIYEFVYRKTFAKIINHNKYWVIRTQDDDYVNSHMGVSEELTPFISFGTDTLLFQPSNEVRAQFRKENNIPEDSLVVVYTGKLTPAKGGKMLAETFNKKFECDKDITLVVVGTPQDNEYGQEVLKLLSTSENRVCMFPTQPYLDLAKFYQAADLSVFPRQCSMSFYDAQACGLPVLSEDNNVNVDRCSHGNGMNFKCGESKDFRDKIIQFANLSEEEREEMSRAAIKFINTGYGYEIIAKEYTEYLSKTVKAFESKQKAK